MQISSIKKLSYLKPLFYKTLVLNVYNFQMKDLINLIKYQRILYESVEQKMLINIFFEEKEIDSLNLRIYENLSLNLYSQTLNTSFNFSKNIILCYPQLFLQKDLLFNISINHIEAIFLYNHTNTDKDNIEAYIKSNEKKPFLFEINQETDDLSSSILVNNDEILPINDKFETYKIGEFNYCAMGGSFDHFHVGHKVMLMTAALITNKNLYIGITSDEMISKKDSPEIIQPFKLRKRIIQEFFRDIGYTKELSIDVLNSTSGKAGESKTLEALIITEETLKGGNFVNETRVKNGLSPVKLIFAEIISAQNNKNASLSDKVSSTAIRKSLKEQSNNISQCFHNWVEICYRIKLSNEKTLIWFSILRDLYMQSWRKYHSLNHIFTYTYLAEKAYKEGKIKDYVNIILAIWFHDSIYVASRQDNEERSVDLFMDFYNDIKNEDGINKDLIDVNKVSFYIMCTKYHFDEKRNYDDIELNYFLDFDLYTFSLSDEKSTLEVSNNIRQEYFLYNDKEWAYGRIKFLTCLHSKDFIYRTEEYRNLYENIAKRNILREIEFYQAINNNN